MIISASRRTDIPAFYSEWFMNRIRAGYCTVPNPYNRDQVAVVALKPENVDVIVFWTRNPRPLFPHLAELDRRGYQYYFQYTVMDNPRAVDPKSPPVQAAISAFKELAGLVGTDRVIWRYDPIVLSAATPPEFHAMVHARIAEALAGLTPRNVISIVDIYRKAQKRLDQLRQQGIVVEAVKPHSMPAMAGELLRQLSRTAEACGMEIASCSEDLAMRPYGIQPGKCVDDDYIARTFGLRLPDKKDPSQREACGCVVSKDIGMYDSCLFGCQYCYATSSFERARRNHDDEHHVDSPSLLGWHDAKVNAATQ
jgi:hypothetical protein